MGAEEPLGLGISGMTLVMILRPGPGPGTEFA